jgi:uncharacterized RDD family membrane protein YckC
MYNCYSVRGDKMEASFSKRVAAYVIDLTVIIMVLFLVSLVYNPDTHVFDEKMNDVALMYTSGDVSFNTYVRKVSSLYRQIDITNIFLNIINVMLVIVYFVIVPYFHNGQTIGKMVMKIKVRGINSQPLSLISLFLRNLIVNGLLYMVLVIFLCLFVPSDIYFLVITFLGILQISLCLVSAIMILYRKDRRGLHDLMAKTWVLDSK